MANLGELFKALRDGLGITQEHFADITGTSHATVGRAENGGPLYRYDSIVRLEEELGAPIDVLLQTGKSPAWMQKYRKLTPKQRAKVDGLMDKALELLD